MPVSAASRSNASAQQASSLHRAGALAALRHTSPDTPPSTDLAVPKNTSGSSAPAVSITSLSVATDVLHSTSMATFATSA